MDSKAVTKIQSVALIAVIVAAAFVGSAAYMFWSAPASSNESVKIGIIGDLDMTGGKAAWRGATLAAEQINGEGGILGRNITIVAEDDDSETWPYDVTVATNALTKLITVDKADYVISSAALEFLVIPYQDISAEHKRIMFSIGAMLDNYTQRVLDNYDKYKYTFRTYSANATSIFGGMVGDVITVGKYTGFTKVALLFDDFPVGKATESGLKQVLPQYGFEVVYSSTYNMGATDFTSNLAAIEASGAQILVPFILGETGSISFVKEWYERQSPFIVWGALALPVDSWKLTEGKCNTVSFAGNPAISGYPLTNRTLPTREALIQRWGEVPSGLDVGAYDTLRFILFDAIKRAGTIETEAVIRTLETTNVETSSARHFVFTSSHDVMFGSGAPNNRAEDYMVVCTFQWQNGTLVPMTPEAIMKEAGATYKFPTWHGPWDNKQTP